MDSRISERLNARLGNLSSERKQNPSPPKTVNIRAPSGEKRLEQSEDGGRSTAISTQRPGERLRPNAVLSPAAAHTSSSQRQDGGGSGMHSAGRGGKSVSRSPSNDRNQAQAAAAAGASSSAQSASAEDPMSAKAKLIQAKKNATITEEDDETESKDEN